LLERTKRLRSKDMPPRVQEYTCSSVITSPIRVVKWGIISRLIISKRQEVEYSIRPSVGALSVHIS